MPVIGQCPYDDCKEVAFRPEPPAGQRGFYRDECEGCGRVVWTMLSRFDAFAMTEADFLAEYEVDEETHECKRRVTETGVP